MGICRGLILSESSNTWKPLKKEFDKVGWHYTRLENNLGIPDLVVFVPEQKRDVWIELKYCSSPDSNGNVDLGLRKEQFILMRQMYNAGRSVILLARIGEWFYIWNNVRMWEMAKKSQSLAEMHEGRALATESPSNIIKVLKNWDFTKSA